MTAGGPSPEAVGDAVWDRGESDMASVGEGGAGDGATWRDLRASSACWSERNRRYCHAMRRLSLAAWEGQKEESGEVYKGGEGGVETKMREEEV